MNRLVEVFCATQRHQKTKNKKQKTETQTKVRMAYSRRDCSDSEASNRQYIENIRLER